MESFKIENLSFTYPNRVNKAVSNINLVVNQGEFITLCGKSGCGKTTFLRLLKTTLSPFGKIAGNIYFNEKLLKEYGAKEQASKIGFVMQNPDNQIVTDKVWHELAFGLESLGYSTNEIRTRVAEMASFFGIQTWFHKKVTELSGGQKQLLNLASIMVMQPSVLILDEPTSQLDPIAAQEFLNTLKKINNELGTTVILTEHRLEDAFSISDRVLVMDNGKIIVDDKPQKVGSILKKINHDMYFALPAVMRIYGELEKSNKSWPITVREGKNWLEEYSKNKKIDASLIEEKETKNHSNSIVIEIKDAWFRYEKEQPDIIKGLSVKINKGNIFAILGGNGAGKTTALSLISGLNTPYRGNVFINEKNVTEISNLYDGLLGVLPQNPQSVFVKKTVYLDLLEALSETKISKDEKIKEVEKITILCQIEELLECHPYDLSGGEQQRVALAKVLLRKPEILLLDEPTKGLDTHFKKVFGYILKDLQDNGVTVVMVSHDIEFCAEYADECAIFFDGNITAKDGSREFFSGKNFYTTTVNRMARAVFPKAISVEDVILACGGKVEKKERKNIDFNIKKTEEKPKMQQQKKLTPTKIVAGSIFALFFILTCFFQSIKAYKIDVNIFQLIAIVELFATFLCFFSVKEFDIKRVQQLKTDRKLSKRTVIATFLILILIPFTIYIGVYFLGGRKYYFISLLIILETLIPFFMIFESRKPQAREIVVISVICGIAVAGRTAFFMLPQFKPVIALIIIAGVCFGGETGFLVGAVTGFVSNFFFGQGPWTPWQMFSLGIIGFIAGILFKKGFLRKNKSALCIFGFLVTVIIYGGIMNSTMLLLSQATLTVEMIIAAYVSGAPFDLIHGVATSFFLWFIAEPMIEKLERIKVKYGLIER